MTKNELTNQYFEWMYQLVCPSKTIRRRPSYRKLLQHLHCLDFTFAMWMDANRAEDGTDLRYRFGYEHDYEGPMIATYLDDRSCSVLEMLVALSIRCEEHIMDNPDIGNRTEQWFWGMIQNLGLSECVDESYDRDYVRGVIATFLQREYEQDGNGGLFSVKESLHDFRTAEIWYQMCWYLDSIL